MIDFVRRGVLRLSASKILKNNGPEIMLDMRSFFEAVGNKIKTDEIYSISTMTSLRLRKGSVQGGLKKA
jgi:hypothetical protein